MEKKIEQENIKGLFPAFLERLGDKHLHVIKTCFRSALKIPCSFSFEIIYVEKRLTSFSTFKHV